MDFGIGLFHGLLIKILCPLRGLGMCPGDCWEPNTWPGPAGDGSGCPDGRSRHLEVGIWLSGHGDAAGCSGEALGDLEFFCAIEMSSSGLFSQLHQT